MAERRIREENTINKSVTGFDYGIAGIIYHRGFDEFSTPSLMVPNEEWSRGIHLTDEPVLIISLEADHVIEEMLDDNRVLLKSNDGTIVGIRFKGSKVKTQLDDLPLSDELKAQAHELFDTYHQDENPDLEDYWKYSELKREHYD